MRVVQHTDSWGTPTNAPLKNARTRQLPTDRATARTSVTSRKKSARKERTWTGVVKRERKEREKNKILDELICTSALLSKRQEKKIENIKFYNEKKILGNFPIVSKHRTKPAKFVRPCFAFKTFRSNDARVQARQKDTGESSSRGSGQSRSQPGSRAARNKGRGTTIGRESSSSKPSSPSPHILLGFLRYILLPRNTPALLFFVSSFATIVPNENRWQLYDSETSPWLCVPKSVEKRAAEICLLFYQRCFVFNYWQHRDDLIWRLVYKVFVLCLIF